MDDLNARFRGGEPVTTGTSEPAASAAGATTASARPVVVGPRQPPVEMRGVHVTMALASIPGKIEEYLSLPGLNKVIPWLQDFSLGRAYTAGDVRAQIEAAFAAGAPGFLVWNAAGIYTADALTYRSRTR